MKSITIKTLRPLFLALLFALFLPALTPPLPARGAMSPRQILDKVDDLFRGDSSHGRMTMSIVTANWRRSLTLEFWSEGKTKSLIRILAPKKEKGTATLRVGSDMWNYLSKTNRVIKLPSSMMSASWMGSHFTNDDLVKESRMTEDYTFEKTFEGSRGGQNIIEITCIPKPTAAVVWGKVLVVVRASDHLPLEMKYFGEDMKPARSMVFSKITNLGGRRLPSTLTVLPVDKPGEKTVVEYHRIEFNINLPDDTFSLRSLKR